MNAERAVRELEKVQTTYLDPERQIGEHEATELRKELDRLDDRKPGPHQPPVSAPHAIPDATKQQNPDSNRRTWKDIDGNTYEWDSQHGTLEKYNKNGKHQGEFDPDTGEPLKPRDPRRGKKRR